MSESVTTDEIAVMLRQHTIGALSDEEYTTAKVIAGNLAGFLAVLAVEPFDVTRFLVRAGYYHDRQGG